ncbi:MAG: hypothetical protein ACK5PG_12905 [Lysobacterales bacterium]|jgi:cation diffusion facilitator CzcD-associated flavoprotein CzcO
MALDSIKNQALGFAMEWGEQWLQPIHARLRVAMPDLDADQLDALNELAQRTLRQAWKAMERLLRSQKAERQTPSDASFREQLGPEFAWIDPANLSRLHSQAMYYAPR